jgi:hypothetical protein
MPAEDILRFNGATPHDPAVNAWFATRPAAELAALAGQANPRKTSDVMRDVNEPDA